MVSLTWEIKGTTKNRGVTVLLLPLVLVGVRPPHAGLLGGRPGGGEAQRLLDVLPDGHGAEDVEEDEGAVREVLAHEVPVREALHPGDGGEGQLGHDLAVEDGVEHGEEGGEDEADGEHGLHLDEHEVAVGVLESLLVALHLALLGAVQGGVAVGLLLLLQPLGLLLDVQLEALVLLRAVHEQPGEALAQQGSADGDAHDQQGVGPHDECLVG